MTWIGALSCRQRRCPLCSRIRTGKFRRIFLRCGHTSLCSAAGSPLFAVTGGTWANFFAPGLRRLPNSRTSSSGTRQTGGWGLFTARSMNSSSYSRSAARRIPIPLDWAKSIVMPTLQGVVRATGIAAMKGNRIAAQSLLSTVQKIEDQETKEHLKYLREIEEYKRQARQLIDEARRKGAVSPHC